MSGIIFLVAWLGLIILVPTYSAFAVKRAAQRKDEQIFNVVEEGRNDFD